MTLSEEAYKASQRIWQEKGMRTFKDLLRFYNNLDFEPFLEALESIRDSYTGLEEMPPFFLKQTRSKRDHTAAHERLLGAQ